MADKERRKIINDTCDLNPVENNLFFDKMVIIDSLIIKGG